MYTKQAKNASPPPIRPITASCKIVNIVSLTYLSTVLVDNYPQALINIAQR